jgi:hypothetical protein
MRSVRGRTHWRPQLKSLRILARPIICFGSEACFQPTWSCMFRNLVVRMTCSAQEMSTFRRGTRHLGTYPPSAIQATLNNTGNPEHRVEIHYEIFMIFQLLESLVFMAARRCDFSTAYCCEKAAAHSLGVWQELGRLEAYC